MAKKITSKHVSFAFRIDIALRKLVKQQALKRGITVQELCRLALEKECRKGRVAA